MNRQIETSILISASIERVWGLLTDFERMPRWNPFITSISGPLQLNARLSVRIVPPGKSGMTFRPTVTGLRDRRELRWRGRLLVSGLFDGEHHFLLGPEADNATRFTQGETFSGLLVGWMGGALAATEAGFVSMNEALKAEAEKA